MYTNDIAWFLFPICQWKQLAGSKSSIWDIEEHNITGRHAMVLWIAIVCGSKETAGIVPLVGSQKAKEVVFVNLAINLLWCQQR